MFGSIFLSRSLAHRSGQRRRWTAVGWTRLVPAGLPDVAVHRVQRRQGPLPLLRHAEQLLAGHRGRPQAVQPARHADAQGGQPVVASVQVPGVLQDLSTTTTYTCQKGVPSF